MIGNGNRRGRTHGYISILVMCWEGAPRGYYEKKSWAAETNTGGDIGKKKKRQESHIPSL